MYDGRDNTKNLWNFISIMCLKENRGGVYWFRTKGNIRKAQKKEVDIVSHTGILIMLILVMITKIMIILLLVLLLLLLTTNKSNNCNNYNNSNVLIIKIVITIKMKSDCALKWKKIKSSYIYYSPHFLFGEKKLYVFKC